MIALFGVLSLLAIIWTIENTLIAVVVVAAAVGLVFIALRVFEVTPPPWVIHVLWICIACAIIVFAIRFVFSL